MLRWFFIAVFAFTLTACASEPVVKSAKLWPELDSLFQHDPRWIGGDGAYSCDLGNNRILWLFGDSSIAKDATRNSDTGWFIRNSLAIQTGYDPKSAYMAFYWGDKDGHPSSFFAESGPRWFWPGACARVGKGLVIFGQFLLQTGVGQFGFGAEGSAAYFVADADLDPLQWAPKETQMPNPSADLILGTAGTIHGDFLFLFGAKGSTHDYVVARFAVKDAEKADFSHGEFFSGGSWQSAANFSAAPAAIFTLGAPESSVHFDEKLQLYTMFQSEGFGATTLAIRTAAAPEGPWSSAESFFRPPESFEEGAFVYAGKGHPEIRGGGMAVSYVPSRFESDLRPQPKDYYFPHFVSVTY